MKKPDNKIKFEFESNTQIKDDKSLNEMIEYETRLLKVIFNEIPLAVFIYDCENLKQISANKLAEERFNCKLEEINKNGYQWFLNQFHPADEKKITNFIKDFIEIGEPAFYYEGLSSFGFGIVFIFLAVILLFITILNFSILYALKVDKDLNRLKQELLIMKTLNIKPNY